MRDDNKSYAESREDMFFGCAYGAVKGLMLLLASYVIAHFVIKFW